MDGVRVSKPDSDVGPYSKYAEAGPVFAVPRALNVALLNVMSVAGSVEA
jgi:hypothetical protein